MLNSLTEKAMLVSLSITMWTARKYDRKVSAEVAQAHNTTKDIGRYHKRLLGDDDTYKAIKEAMGEARTWFYSLTLPWTNDGARILPSALFLEFSNGARDRKAKFGHLVRKFLDAYPTLKQEAKILLNGLYNEQDYPYDIEGRFSFDTKVFPLPDAGDFRVQLADADIACIRAQLTDEMQSVTASAMRDVWTRLYEPVSRMVERLSEPDAEFRNTLVSNLQDVCKLLPALNLEHNQDLATLCSRVESELLAYAPETLRTAKDIRADVAARAKAIQDTMSAYMEG